MTEERLPTADEFQPATLLDPPENAADAVRQQAKIDALTDWLGVLRENVRDRIREFATGLSEASGGIFNLPVSGVGRAYYDDPSASVTIANHDKFADYLRTRDDFDADSFIIVRDRVVVSDHEMAADAIRTMIEGPDTADIVEGAAELLSVVHVETETTVDTSALDALVDNGHAKIAGDWLVEVDTGARIEGVSVTPARAPRLTVTIDKQHKQELRRQIETLIGPPELTEPTEGEG